MTLIISILVFCLLPSFSFPQVYLVHVHTWQLYFLCLDCIFSDRTKKQIPAYSPLFHITSLPPNADIQL